MESRFDTFGDATLLVDRELLVDAVPPLRLLQRFLEPAALGDLSGEHVERCVGERIGELRTWAGKLLGCFLQRALDRFENLRAVPIGCATKGLHRVECSIESPAVHIGGGNRQFLPVPGRQPLQLVGRQTSRRGLGYRRGRRRDDGLAELWDVVMPGSSSKMAQLDELRPRNIRVPDAVGRGFDFVDCELRRVEYGALRTLVFTHDLPIISVRRGTSSLSGSAILALAAPERQWCAAPEPDAHFNDALAAISHIGSQHATRIVWAAPDSASCSQCLGI